MPYGLESLSCLPWILYWLICSQCDPIFVGGSIYAVLGIVDAMLAIKPSITTVVFGVSGSIVSLILVGIVS